MPEQPSIPKQRANLANAQKSTGPKTQEGKAPPAITGSG